MSLQKQLVHLNMTGGLQTKDDGFLVIPSKLVVADNVEFDDESTVKVRGGLVNVPVTSLAVLEALSNARRAITHNGQLLIEADSGNYRVTDSGLVQVYPVDSSTTRGARVFPRASALTRREGAILASTSTYPLFPGDMDSAVLGSVQFLAWETRDPSSGLNTIRFQIQNVMTGKVLREGLLTTIFGKSLTRPRVVTYGSDFILYYAACTPGAVTFEIRRIAWSTTGAVSKTEASVVTSSAGGFPVEYDEKYAVCFDVATLEDPGFEGIGLVYKDVDAASTIRIRGLDVTDYASIIRSRDVAPVAYPKSLTALVTYDGLGLNTLVHAFYSEGANTFIATGLNISTGAAIATTTVGTAPAGSVCYRAAAYFDGASINLAWDARPATLEQSTLHASKFNAAYGALSECSAFSPWHIAGRIVLSQNRMMLPMMHSASEAVVDNGIFVVDFTSVARNVGVANNNEPPHVVARLDCGEVSRFLSTWRGHNRVPSAAAFNAASPSGVIETGFALTYPKFESNFVVAGAYNDTASCVTTALITSADASLSNLTQLGQVEVNGLTFMAGACPMLFDGTSFVEEGFHNAPWIAFGPAAAAGGTYGPFPSGAVTFCFTLGWQDDAGNWHESAPSNEVTVTFAPGTLYCTPVVVLPPTQKKGTVLRMYRTKKTSTDTSLYLSTTASGIFVSNDSDLANSEQIYTAGGVLPNTPAPACRHASIFQRRVVLSGCGDGTRVHWSKQFSPGYGVEFCASDSTHYTTVPASAGRAVATAEMDDRLVVLCERSIGLITGNGPAPTGTQGQYSEYATIVTEAGCFWNAPRSVARGPEGVWFRSMAGIRLVSRSGALARGQDGKQVGSEVDRMMSGACVAVAHPSKQQIHFHQTNDTVLVWDYQWTQWSRFAAGVFDIADAAVADGRVYHVGSASVRYISESAPDDLASGTPVSGTIETPWIALAGIQGYQRAYRLMVLGRDMTTAWGDATITIATYYDYIYDGAIGGGTATALCQGGRYQAQHHFAQQKCEAIKLNVSMSVAGGSRLRLTDLTLQVGVKAGYNKLPSSARF